MTSSSEDSISDSLLDCSSMSIFVANEGGGDVGGGGGTGSDAGRGGVGNAA